MLIGLNKYKLYDGLILLFESMDVQNNKPDEKFPFVLVPANFVLLELFDDCISK